MPTAISADLGRRSRPRVEGDHPGLVIIDSVLLPGGREWHAEAIGLYSVLDRDWNTTSPQTRAALLRRFGAASPEEARERAAAVTLEEAAPHITTPLLVVHGQRDRLAPPHHAELLAGHAPGAELVMYPEGNHGITNQPFVSRSLIADWLGEHLGAGG